MHSCYSRNFFIFPFFFSFFDFRETPLLCDEEMSSSVGFLTTKIFASDVLVPKVSESSEEQTSPMVLPYNQNQDSDPLLQQLFNRCCKNVASLLYRWKTVVIYALENFLRLSTFRSCNKSPKTFKSLLPLLLFKWNSSLGFVVIKFSTKTKFGSSQF